MVGTVNGPSGARPRGLDTERLPPFEFGYTKWRPEARRFQPLMGELPTIALGDAGMDLVDMFGDGRASILQLDGTARYWRKDQRARRSPALP